MDPDKALFNDLLSRFDTLHDFCNPSADRNKDKSLGKNDKAGKNLEYANVFKPEILKALEKEIKVSKTISKGVLISTFDTLIRRYITDKSSVGFYKNDLDNLIDRTKNGLAIVSALRTVDKETFDKTSSRTSQFEPCVVAFYEFLYNVSFQKENSIGKFVSNKYLPIFDFVNGEYKYVITTNGTAKYTKVAFTPNTNYFTNETKVNEYIQKCVENKENIVTFILGKIDEDDKNERSFFLEGANDVSGFYKFAGNIKHKKVRLAADEINFQKLYFSYLDNLRKILGKYFDKADDVMINLILDTSNVSFSKYYKILNDTDRNRLKIRVLCNVAMNWDGANSPECQTRSQDKGELNIKHDAKKNMIDRAIFDLDYIELSQPKHDATTIFSFDSSKAPKSSDTIKPIPREVGEISECIRQQINKKRSQTSECKRFSNKGSLLDLKRTGDALQALIANQLNIKAEATGDKEFYVFVTLDHLAFLKARLQGIPTLYTNLQDDASNRVIVLFNSKFTKNYKSLAGQLNKELELFNKAYVTVTEQFPIITSKTNNEKNESYYKFYLLLDYLCRLMFGIVLFIRPTSVSYSSGETDFIKIIAQSPSETFIESDFMEKSDGNIDETIMTYLKVLLSENYNLLNKFQDKWKFQYYKPYKNVGYLNQLVGHLSKISTTIDNINKKILKKKSNLLEIVIKNRKSDGITLNIPEDHGLIDSKKILENIEMFILNSFIIECFYTIKRAGIFRQYLKDHEKIDEGDVERIIRIFEQEPMNDSKASSDGLNYLDLFRSLNSKYQCFTAPPDDNDITLSATGEVEDNSFILSTFFDNFKYTPDSSKSKKYLNRLFGFKYDEYKIFLENIEKDIDTIYEKDIDTKIKFFEDKLSKPEYFDEPVRRSRQVLTVEEKMIECEDFFKPNNFEKNLQELLYKKIYNKCESFYKTKIIELGVIKISSKPIPFEKAVEKITKDELNLRSGGRIKVVDEIVENNDSAKDNKDDKDDKDKQTGGAPINEKIINNISTFFDCDLLYEESTYDDLKISHINKVSLDTYKSIWNKYKHFIIDIWSSEEGNRYFPILINLDKNTYEDWGLLPQNINWYGNSFPAIGDIINYIVYWGDRSLLEGKHWNYTGVNVQNLKTVYGRDMRLFILDILSELLKQTVDLFYEGINNYFMSMRGRNIISLEKGKNAILDTIIWIMINDPGFLFYHPKRNNLIWKDIEYQIIDLLWGDIYSGGGGKRPHGHISRETLIEEDNSQIESYDYFDTGRFDNGEGEDEVESDFNKRQRYIDDDIDYFEFATEDECLFMKCVFDNDFMLKTNLGLLASIDTNDLSDGPFKFREGINIYNPVVIDSKRIVRGENHPFRPDNFGGEITLIRDQDQIKKPVSLADYHKKYYKQYYNLYYR